MFCCCSLLSVILSGTASIVLFLCVLARYLSRKVPEIRRHDCERTYFNYVSKEKKQFPDLILSSPDQKIDPPTLFLSIIIPAYNEEKRLPKMLQESVEYLEKQSYQYEIIVVNDGSKDNTALVVEEFANSVGNDKIKLLQLERNHGKGGAVRLGVLSSKGELILFADADGATKFEDLEKLEHCLHSNENHHVAIGSRAHLEKEAIASRSLFRTLLMYGFHFIVWLFTVRTVRDTQCGFKMFRREIAIKLFNSMHVEGWAFDVELIYLLEYLKVKVFEIPVNWVEVEGSKIVPVFSWIAMGLDVLKISFMYTIGAWQLPSPQTK